MASDLELIRAILLEGKQWCSDGSGLDHACSLRALATLELVIGEGLDREWTEERRLIAHKGIMWGKDGHKRILAILDGEKRDVGCDGCDSRTSQPSVCVGCDSEPTRKRSDVQRQEPSDGK